MIMTEIKIIKGIKRNENPHNNTVYEEQGCLSVENASAATSNVGRSV